MIRYTLRCQDDHAFETWFRDSAAYDDQAAAGLLQCPACGSSDITKALMTPSIGKSAKRQDSTPAPGDQRAAMGVDPEAMAKVAALRRGLLELRAKVEQNCDYVGSRFAEEARRIHYGEVEARGIYGETTKDEAASLKEEGVEFAAVPWVEKDHA